MRDIVRALLVLSMFHGVVQGGPPPDQDVRKNGTPQALSEEMILLGEDWYYPQEEPAERAELSVPKLEQLEEEAAMLVLAEEESPARVAVGETRGGWRVMAVLPEPEGMVVLEKEFQRWGVIFFLNRQGVVAEIRKSVGHLEAIRGPRYGLSDSYFNTIVHDDKDLLANRIFEDTGDPSYESLVGMLAPLHTYTFLGTPDSAEKMAIQHDGKIGILPKKWGGDKKLERVLLDPNTVFAKQVDLADPRAMKRGLLGRHLPAINYGCFDLGKDFGWELCALAPPEAPGAVLARLRSSEGITHYYRIAPLESLEDGRAFYRALIESHRHWQSFFEKGAGWNIPDPRVEDATRGAIVRALSGCVGLHPKYGMGGYWGGKSHDGFPPTVLSLCTCLLDWGFDEAARDRLEYYYSHFVKPDGTLDYYGPAVAEYGQLLDLGVAVARKTGDPAWFDRQSAAIGRMADHLLGLREQSLREQSPADPGYGLLFGWARAAVGVRNVAKRHPPRRRALRRRPRPAEFPSTDGQKHFAVRAHDPESPGLVHQLPLLARGALGRMSTQGLRTDDDRVSPGPGRGMFGNDPVQGG